ncbi:C6 zinc finger domain-containing protein [Colletotrichum truncatum]|uniref:C6 zinc finger domain-containing protein n=1 Tax=Colletotrichum truncatum TaxID=5467 RepID=A0ACC3ZG90_COLTU|nr:C6 zinc finger domain-containing protein [Colletotrichum truncatum]KAF6784628.1 C6 zinc finger domain-containing protein [Colletotrichum truncatum]
MSALPEFHQPSTNSRLGNESSAAVTKRSRVVISQSKGGCVTCKTRRVKCDEQKPLCRRCIQAGRICGSYNYKSKSSSALRPPLKVGIAVNSHAERLSYLAAHVLSLDNNSCLLQDDDVWGRVFYQLSNQVECVKAAAVAFGAAYESSLSDTIFNGTCSAWHYYGSALAKLQSDYNNEAVGPESLVLASMILACVEILSQHEQNAFVHFLGAVQTLDKIHHRGWRSVSTDIVSIVKDGLIQMNLIICSYGLSRTPQFMYLESQEGTDGDDIFREPELAIKGAMRCLRRVYQFVESAARLRYTYPSWKDYDLDMCKNQSDAVTYCRSVLNGLMALSTTLQAHYSCTTSTLKASETLADIFAIRTQLTSALIFALCAHSPYETVYDEHQDLFRSIVSDAAASARLRRQTKSSALKRFSTRPGIVSPLFIVSMKCRDPTLRALATTMLSEQSREGPADGQILAAIGARMAKLETSASIPSYSGGPLAASNILEEHRIGGYTVPHPRLDSEGRRVVDILFSRPNPPLAEGWGHVNYSSQDGWIYWSEPVEI